MTAQPLKDKKWPPFHPKVHLSLREVRTFLGPRLEPIHDHMPVLWFCDHVTSTHE